MPIRPHVFVISAVTRHVVGSSVLACRFIASHLGPLLLLHLSYFVTIDLLGFLALVLLNKAPITSSLRYIDLFFMSTSAVTVTGLATVRMEALSGAQMAVLTVLMLLGSEVFVSLLRLAVVPALSSSRDRNQPRRGPVEHDGCSRVRSVVTVRDGGDDEEANNNPPVSTTTSCTPSTDNHHDYQLEEEKKSCCSQMTRCLGLVVLAYTLVILLVGSLLVFAYVSNVPSARDVLTRKSIGAALFSASVTVSSFANGGLLPTNEGMAAFATSQGLLLLLVGQILAGGTLFSVFLRLVLRATRGIMVARVPFIVAERPGGGQDDDGEELIRSMAKDAMAAGFTHLLPGLQTALVAATAVAVAAVAVTLFCFLNWDTAVFAGLTAGEKVTNALFMAVNARQAGENSVDCSLIAPAVLVLFVAMMCTPASASFFLVHDGGGGGEELVERKDGAKRRRRVSLSHTLWSPLVFKAAAVMLVCITERRSLSSDPLNFSTFNMVFEVISAYRNVGLSIGYSCSRLLRPEEASACHDQPYSFSGWWSDQGKLLLVLLMLCGRLKGICKQRRRN